MPVTFSNFLKHPHPVHETNAFLCDGCGSNFERSRKQVKYALSVGRETMYCSKPCQTLAQRRQLTKACETCGRPVTRNRAAFELSERHFCSKSCAAAFNNRASPKRRASQHECLTPLCTNNVVGRRKFCENCRTAAVTQSNVMLWLKKWGTLGGLQCKAKYQVHARVRSIARVVYRVLKHPRCCRICGYSKTFDVCHRRDISEFPASALIAEVNDPTNLVGLCKNHHWEFDHDQLSVEDMKRLDGHLRLVADHG